MSTEVIHAARAISRNLVPLWTISVYCGQKWSYIAIISLGASLISKQHFHSCIMVNCGWNLPYPPIRSLFLLLLLARRHEHMTSAKFSGFLTRSPLVCILDQFKVLNSRNLLIPQSKYGRDCVKWVFLRICGVMNINLLTINTYRAPKKKVCKSC